MTPPDPQPPGSESLGEVASVQFPDMFKEQLERYIPNGAQRVFFMEDGLHEEAALNWKHHILLAADNANSGRGAITTVDGYQGVPALILDFEFGHAAAGTPWVVFNNVTPVAAPSEAEDDS